MNCFAATDYQTISIDRGIANVETSTQVFVFDFELHYVTSVRNHYCHTSDYNQIQHRRAVELLRSDELMIDYKCKWFTHSEAASFNPE